MRKLISEDSIFPGSFQHHLDLVAEAPPETVWYTDRSLRVSPLLPHIEFYRFPHLVAFARLTQVGTVDYAAPPRRDVANDIPGRYEYDKWTFTRELPGMVRYIKNPQPDGSHRAPFRQNVTATTLSICGLYARLAPKESELSMVANKLALWSANHNMHNANDNTLKQFSEAAGALVLQAVAIDDYKPPLPDQLLTAFRIVGATSWRQPFADTMRNALESVVRRQPYAGYNPEHMDTIGSTAALNAARAFKQHGLIGPPQQP